MRRPQLRPLAPTFVRVTLRTFVALGTFVALLAGRGLAQPPLASGKDAITQTWSQESAYERPFFVHVPRSDSVAPARRQKEAAPDQNDGEKSRTETSEPPKLPVLIFLHGNGGNAAHAMNGFLRRHPRIASRYILAFPQGYRESWNIVSERSKAHDVEFIESIITRLSDKANVDASRFSIMGVSNGAALVNQLAIESRLPQIRNLITSVSPLNQWQYDGREFKAKGNDNRYRVAVTPITGRRLMNISGTEDRLVPYGGGPSPLIPAWDGKLAFVAAEESTFLWARHLGGAPRKLAQPTRVVGNVEIFDYLGGNVVHCKVNGEGHGATGAINEERLLAFLDGG